MAVVTTTMRMKTTVVADYSSGTIMELDTEHLRNMIIIYAFWFVQKWRMSNAITFRIWTTNILYPGECWHVDGTLGCGGGYINTDDMMTLLVIFVVLIK